MNYEKVMNHLDKLEEQRIQMVECMVKGTPNEQAWLEALQGMCNVRKQSYENARRALEEAFNNKLKE